MASDIKFFRLFVIANVILYPTLCLLLFYLLIIQEKEIMRPLMLVSAIASACAMVCSFYIGINSFRLLTLIKKNRITLAQQIKNIGAGE